LRGFLVASASRIVASSSRWSHVKSVCADASALPSMRPVSDVTLVALSQIGLSFRVEVGNRCGVPGRRLSDVCAPIVRAWMHRLMWQFQANDFRKQASSGGCVANIGNVRTASRLLLLLFASLAGGLHPRSIHGQVMPTPLIARPQPVRQVVSIGTAITP